MKVIKFLVTLISITFFCAETKAQSFTLSGTIQDEHTNEPIGFASVYFTKSVIGKTSDSAGNFTFQFNNRINDTLVISYIGYELYKIPTAAFTNDKPLTLLLTRGGLHNTVIVKMSFNKGLYLWKKIMSKKKQSNRYNLTNFGYEAYNKLELDLKNFRSNVLLKGLLFKAFPFILNNVDSTSENVPILPAYLTESISNYSYQKDPKKSFEGTVASNTKGIENESVSRFTGVMEQNVNIYNNFINVIDKDFISPFHDNADAFYNFSVPDTQIVNGNKIFHFVFSSKHAGQNTFEGDAWVTAKTFQIQKISLYLGKDANLNFIDRISVFQEFFPINDSLYFLTRDKFFADFRVLGKKTITFIGRKTTTYKNIIINSDSLTNFFKGQSDQQVIKIENGSTKRTEKEWEQLRHDSLSVNEKAIYATVDKLLAMPKFKKLEHTLKFVFTGYKNIGNFEIGPWFNWISTDTLQGARFRFDLGTNKHFNKNIYLHGYLAYGLRDKKLKGQAEAYWVVKRAPKRITLHLSYTDDIDNGISQLGEVSQDNIFSIAIRKNNTSRKYIGVKDLRFEVFNDLGKGFSTEWFISHRQNDPLANLPLKNKFPVSSGTSFTNFELAVKLRWAYLERFFETDFNRYSLGTKYPVAELVLAQGIPGVLKSAYSYTKLYASVKDKIRVSTFGSLSYNVYAGKVFGTLPYAFLEFHPGNDLYYYNKNSFNLMTRFEYLSDQFAGINIEHNIGSGLFRFTPLTRKLKWRQFWNAKAVWGSLSSKNTALNNSTGTFKTLNGNTYLELGTGIDNIFRFLRLDFVWKVLPTPKPGIKSSQFGIFGSIQFQF